MPVPSPRLSALLLSLAASPLWAEGAAPVPAQSVETYDAWTVECATVPGATAEAKPQRLCEAAQTYKNQKTGNEVARIAFALAADTAGADKSLHLALRTLVDVSFDQPPVILLGGEPLLPGKMQRCAGNACYASFAVTADQVKQVQGATDLKLRFPISNGSLFQIDMSSKGLADALAVLQTRASE